MYLIFRASLKGIACATLDTEGSVVAHSFWANTDWDNQNARKIKDSLQKELKVQGRVFQGIGYVLPFGDGKNEAPRAADLALFKTLAVSPLHDTLLKPSRLLFEAGHIAWPHLPHLFLFDTFLSTHLPKHLILPGVSYESATRLSLEPRLLHSYGHRANSLMVKEGQKFISLYVDRAVSVALFDGHILKDAFVSYSPLSPIGGFAHLGALDLGTAALLLEKLKPAERTDFILQQTGLAEQLDHEFSFEESLEIAGLVPRKDLGFMDKLEIETIEWTELSMKSFVRSLRHALAAMLATDNAVKTLVVNTTAIPQKSGLWSLLTDGSLSQLNIVYSDILDLQAAGTDLIESHTA